MLKKNRNTCSKEYEIFLFGHLAHTFGKNLIDISEKPPELIKTVFKICDVIHSYFKVITNYIFNNNKYRKHLNLYNKLVQLHY